MGSQICEHCGASVSADEQFCTECGSFIDPLHPPRPAPSGNIISVTSDGTYEEFSLEDRPPPEDVPASDEPERIRSGQPVPCPSCGTFNPASNRHCQECGARLSQAPLPTAPRPAVQATAGVRAAVAISGLLFIVIVVALIFNVFNGDGTASNTTIAATTTTQPQILEPAPIDVLDVTCDPKGLGSYTCPNLVSDSSAEYQVNWEDIQAAEGNITIRLTFRQPMIVTRIDWLSIEDPTRFRQNYRARGLTIDAQGSLTEVPAELEDTPGLQNLNYAAVNANWIEITIQSAYQAEVSDGNVYRELAIAGITVWGRPANPTTTETTGG